MDTTNRQLSGVISRWDHRLRFTQLAIWLPRGLAVGLVFGLVVAMISRLRPWLQTDQIMTFTLIAASMGMLAAAVGVLIWPRSAIQKARYFDSVFGLKERTITALELSSGLIKAPASFTALQAQDAIDQARAINARRYLTVRWRSNELLVVLGLMVALLVAFMLVNPQNSVLAQQRNLDLALAEQVQRLEKIEQTIQNNSTLSTADKAELNKIAQDAINQLQQANITQPEAVAALTRAENELNNAKTQLSAQQRAAAQDAAKTLGGTQATQGTGQSLAAGNLTAAASQLQDLAQKIGNGQLTPEQLSDLAKTLSQAAGSLNSLNAAAAEALKQAAQALKNGDNAGAQKALNAAAQALAQQQQKNDTTPRSQAAQQAAQQADQSKSALSNVNSGSSSSSKPSSNSAGNSQQADNQSGQQQAGQNASQPGSQSQSGQSSDKQNSSNDAKPTDENNGSVHAADAPNAGQTKPLTSADQASGANDQLSSGVSENALPRAGQSNQFNSASQNQGPQGDGGLGAGQGQGGAGNDITQGAADTTSSGFDTNNGHGDGSVAPYERVYAPSFVGGKGGDPLNLKSGTSQNNGGSDPATAGDFGPSATGLSTVPLSSVSVQASNEADVAMDAAHVPGALRGVIRDYFTSLQNH